MPTNDASHELTNALIRCKRSDELAKPVFEQVSKAPSLWVLELREYEEEATWELELEAVYERLLVHRELLLKLANESADCTLHLTATGPEYMRMILPTKFFTLTSECGFQIEVYRFDGESQHEAGYR